MNQHQQETIVAVVKALNEVEVKGVGNLDRILASIQALTRLLNEPQEVEEDVCN